VPPTVPAEPVATAPDAPPGVGVPAPDVLGMDHKAAQAAVRAAGLLWREIGDVVPDEDPEGIVVRQTPAAGRPVLDGNVELVVSRHAAKVVAPPAPDVVGRTEADARGVLSGSRYHVSVEYEDVDAPRVGLVPTGASYAAPIRGERGQRRAEGPRRLSRRRGPATPVEPPRRPWSADTSGQPRRRPWSPDAASQAPAPPVVPPTPR
jgi:hypothetical protein